MANASRRQQDTMVSKSKYWSAVRLAPGCHPSSELVRTYTCCTPLKQSGAAQFVAGVVVDGFHFIAFAQLLQAVFESLVKLMTRMMEERFRVAQHMLQSQRKVGRRGTGWRACTSLTALF